GPLGPLRSLPERGHRRLDVGRRPPHDGPVVALRERMPAVGRGHRHGSWVVPEEGGQLGDDQLVPARRVDHDLLQDEHAVEPVAEGDRGQPADREAELVGGPDPAPEDPPAQREPETTRRYRGATDGHRAHLTRLTNQMAYAATRSGDPPAVPQTDLGTPDGNAAALSSPLWVTMAQRPLDGVMECGVIGTGEPPDNERLMGRGRRGAID